MSSPEAFDILGFGVVAVDDLLYVQQYPAAESKVRVSHRLRQCGGLTGTALVAASRLGARCAYVGMLGDDDLSKEALDCFMREGIDISHRARNADARPAHSTIIVDETHRTRTIFASLEAAAGASPDWPPADLIHAARVLLVDHHGVEGTLRAVRIAQEQSVQVVADFERHPGGEFKELLQEVNHLVISQKFAEILTGDSDPPQAAQALWNDRREAVIITCGGKGCCYLGKGYDKPITQPAFSVEAVDTTGCGDVFHGAYAAALAWNLPLAERVQFAAATAALKAQVRGGQAGCPSRQEVETFLKRRTDF
jgi:sugar/nucleoside kinase (ribokinase family)